MVIVLDPHIDSIFLWEYSPPLDISRLSPDNRFDTNSGAWLSNKSKPEARELGTWKAKLSDTLLQFRLQIEIKKQTR